MSSSVTGWFFLAEILILLGVVVGAPIMKVSSRSPRSSDGRSDGRSFQIVFPRSSAPSFFQKNGLSFLMGFGGARGTEETPFERDDETPPPPPPREAIKAARREFASSSSPPDCPRLEIAPRNAGRRPGGAEDEGEVVEGVSSSAEGLRLEIDERKARLGRAGWSEGGDGVRLFVVEPVGFRREAMRA